MALQRCELMQAWQLASPVAEPYREFAERWGNADFSKYVDILEQNADEAIQDADEVRQTPTDCLLLMCAGLPVPSACSEHMLHLISMLSRPNALQFCAQLEAQHAYKVLHMGGAGFGE